MINCLQIIVLLPLLETSIPSNAGMFFAEFSKIAAFDLLEFEYFNFGDFMDSILDLIPTGPINSKFEAIGFESLYFINNLGSFFLVLVFGLLLIPIWLVLNSIGLKSKWA